VGGKKKGVGWAGKMEMEDWEMKNGGCRERGGHQGVTRTKKDFEVDDDE